MHAGTLSCYLRGIRALHAADSGAFVRTVGVRML